MIKSGIYIIKFENSEEMKSFLEKDFENIQVRGIFKKNSSISAYLDKKGYLKVISEGLLPKFINSTITSK